MNASVILDQLISESNGDILYYDSEIVGTTGLIKEAILRGFQIRNAKYPWTAGGGEAPNPLKDDGYEEFGSGRGYGVGDGHGNPRSEGGGTGVGRGRNSSSHGQMRMLKEIRCYSRFDRVYYIGHEEDSI